MLVRNLFKTRILRPPTHFKSHLYHRPYMHFSQQTAPRKIIPASQQQNSNSSNTTNMKKNVDFMNFQAFIDKMKAFYNLYHF